MFDGKVKSSKSVFMGGVKKDTSTKNLVDNARKLREQRLEERVKQNSATIIQARWRGYRVRASFKLRLISELDQKIMGIKNIKSLLSSKNQLFNVPLESILYILKCFYFIYLKKTTGTTFESHLQYITTLVLDSLNTSIPDYSILSKLKSPSVDNKDNQIRVWMIYIKKVMFLILEYIDKAGTINNMNNIYLLFDSLFFSDSKNSQVELSYALSFILKSIMFQICKVLCKIFRYDETTWSQSSSSQTDSVTLSKLVNLLLRLVVQEIKQESRLTTLQLATATSSSSSVATTTTTTTTASYPSNEIQTFVTKTILTLPSIYKLNMFQPLFQYLDETDKEGWCIVLDISNKLLVDVDAYAFSTNHKSNKKKSRSDGSATSSGMSKESFIGHMYGIFSSDLFLRLSIYQNFTHSTLLLTDDGKSDSQSKFSTQGMKFLLTDSSSTSERPFDFIKSLNEALKYAPLVLTQYLMEDGITATTTACVESLNQQEVEPNSLDFGGIKNIEVCDLINDYYSV